MLETILFPVKKVSTLEATNGLFSGTGENAFKVLGHIDGNWRELNSCADRYALVPNEDIFPVLIQKIKDLGLSFETTVSHTDFQKFYVKIRLTDQAYTVGNNLDVIYPEITIHHSYNGKMNYAMSAGWFRMICSNGLVVPAKGKEKENFYKVGKHTSSIFDSINMIHEFIDNFQDSAQPLIKRFEVLSDRAVLDYGQRLEEVINAVGGRLPKKLLEPAAEIIGKEMGILGLQTANDWLIYNSLNESLYNDDLNKIHNDIRMDIDSKVLEFVMG